MEAISRKPKLRTPFRWVANHDHMATFLPLGDQAVLAYLPDESAASRFAATARAAMQPEWLDIVQAYSSVAIHFDPDRSTFANVVKRLKQLDWSGGVVVEPRRHVIPCCYELGPDLEHVARVVGFSPDDVVRLHCEVDYTVYAIGFCPGFPFLGYLKSELSGVPRVPAPRKKVEPGSVGMTGRQTGIYPLERPGGWNLIGKTPFVLVDVVANYFPLSAGDHVRFEEIDRLQFDALRGCQLARKDM
jgi:inhibitor of KinA